MRWYSSPRIVKKALLAVLGIFTAAPLVWVFVRSFENPVTLQVDNILVFWERYLSLQQYATVLFHDLEYWAAYWNTVLLTLPAVLAAVCAVSMAAYGLTVIKRTWQKRILMVYGILALLPMQVLLVPHLIVLSEIQMIGSRLAVILIVSSSPWYVFFLHRLCEGVPKDVFEAARIEGAGEWQIFLKVALPQMRTGLMIFVIVISADLWGMVEEPLVYLQDASKYPLSVLFHEMGLSISYAGVLLFALPVVGIFGYGIWETMKGSDIS